MPKYKTFKYGKIAKYGKYDIRGGSQAVGEYVRYRMRYHDAKGNKSDYITMAQTRVDAPGSVDRFRIRSNNDEWLYNQAAEVPKEVYTFRIRSLEGDGGYSEWVYHESAKLEER